MKYKVVVSSKEGENVIKETNSLIEALDSYNQTAKDKSYREKNALLSFYENNELTCNEHLY